MQVGTGTASIASYQYPKSTAELCSRKLPLSCSCKAAQVRHFLPLQRLAYNAHDLVSFAKVWTTCRESLHPMPTFRRLNADSEGRYMEVVNSQTLVSNLSLSQNHDQFSMLETMTGFEDPSLLEPIPKLHLIAFWKFMLGQWVRQNLRS